MGQDRIGVRGRPCTDDEAERKLANGLAPPPAVFAPPRGNPRFPGFDSLRAVAALSVLLLHSISVGGGLGDAPYSDVLIHLDIGVTIFFLISGFLLYRPMLATRVLGAPALPWRSYARRRFLRIVPGYWVALLALSAFPGIYGVLTGNWWVYFGLLQNYPVYTPTGDCAADALRCGISPVWSLGIEVGFYATLPFFALALGWLGRLLGAARWFTVELLALAAVGLVSIPVVLHVETEAQQLLWASPLGHGLWFVLGMALAAGSVRFAETGRLPRPLEWLAARSSLAWMGALALYLLASLVLLDPLPGLVGSDLNYGAEYVLFGLIATLLLLPAVFDDGKSGLPGRILASPVLGWLGLISYGIFLYNWPIALALSRGGVGDWWPAGSAFVMTAMTLVVTLPCAAASYYLVERPLIRLKRGGRSRTVEGKPRAGPLPG